LIIVCIGRPKSEAEVTDNMRLRSKYCTVEANLPTDRHEASRASLRQHNYLYYSNVPAMR